MAGSGVVDASGVVSSVLSGYRQVLVECQRRVTGDPGALSAASQRVATQASTVSGKAREIDDSAKTLHADWDGDAYTAFATAAGELGKELTDAATKLDDQAKRLATASQLVQSAKAAVDSVLAQFDQYAQQLTAQARAVNSASVGAFIQAARQLGEQSVQAARQVVDEFSEALAELFPPEGTQRLEHKLGKKTAGPLGWLNGSPLDGRKRPRDAPSWFKNSGWKKLTWDGLEGTRAPKKADTPFGQPKPEGLKDKLGNNTEITYYKFKHEQDGLTPEYDGKITSKGWDVGASGHTELAAVKEEGELKGRLGRRRRRTPRARCSPAVRRARPARSARTAWARTRTSSPAARSKARSPRTSRASASARTARCSTASARSSTPRPSTTPGTSRSTSRPARRSASAPGVGAKIDIDLPKLGHTIGEYGGAAADAVGSAAHDAADAVGSAWDDAVSYVGL